MKQYLNSLWSGINSKWGKRVLILVAFLVAFWISLPSILFDDSYSTVVYGKNSKLLGAKIALDGQWRFPESDSIPIKFSTCLIEFEDRHFYHHPGLNPISLFRAIRLNLKHGKKTSGGSTISMQVIRMHRKNPSRTYWEKLIELYLAIRLEAEYSKDEILNLYASHAPFGGNTVGLEAASWRYFGRPSDLLSWAESATLAVLPNSPAIIFPGKNQDRLLRKRNNLLLQLYKDQKIDKQTYELSLLEPIPGAPKPIPQEIPHLMLRIEKDGHTGKTIHTTVELPLQRRLNQHIAKHHEYWRQNEIHNMAAMVINTQTGELLAYVGNVEAPLHPKHHENVDIIAAPRSTGSILKPFLFALALQEGILYPSTLVQDIPLHIHGYSPKNFSLSYDGIVPAKRALGRSLNIPAVKILQQIGTDKLNIQLKKLGMHTLTKNAKHYGLSIILGGAEGNLWELTGMYASMARAITPTNKNPIFPPHYLPESSILEKNNATFDPGVAWLTLEAMVEVARPDLEASWREFSSGSKVAWKTGTSFGFRDGWAIGVNPSYTVGVWVGNANGEGRPGLTGIATAAPLLFDIFSSLPRSNWFKTPSYSLKQVRLCSQSGLPPSELCPNTQIEWVQKNSNHIQICSYHKMQFLDKEKLHRVTGDCYQVSEMEKEVYFVLNPVEEWYFKAKNPGFKSLPPFKPGCDPKDVDTQLGLVYPTPNAKIFIPRNHENIQLGIICRATHKQENASVYWSLDGEFITTTTTLHEIQINPEPGKHRLNVTDHLGESHTIAFEIIKKANNE
ncbi:MAG: penicillin-binding protein 1C [Bacteroidia bacterium]|nr:penicillin-binding protein 1C [Bacteroidia bacterium]